MRRLLLAALLAAGCGTGTDGKPVAPTAPAPEPAPPPTVRAVGQVWSQAFEGSYDTHERIRVVLDFEDRTIVEGEPRLGIQIGEHVRLADFAPWVEHDWPPEQPSYHQRFVYEVRSDDKDVDGISVAGDALDFSEGAILSESGGEIEVRIDGLRPGHEEALVASGEPLEAHRVLGWGEPRVCTDERAQALAFDTVLVREWTGEPFVFYFDTVSLPAADREDAEHILVTVERLSERIEDQIGYSLIAVGGWTRAPGVDCNARYRRWRSPGQIVAHVIADAFRLNTGEIIPQAVTAGTHCATVKYWDGDVNIQRDSIIGHELFHLFGFAHARRPYVNGWIHSFQSPEGIGVSMSPRLSHGTDPPHLGVTFEDIDALRCIFPEGG